MDERVRRTVKAIQGVVTGDLVKLGTRWASDLDRYRYLASGAVHRLRGGHYSGYTPYRVP